MKQDFNKKQTLRALRVLDSVSFKSFELIIAGGSAMVCSYEYPLTTNDVDAVIRKADISEVDTYIKKTAKKLSLPPDWLNIWVSSFTHYLPLDYETRLNTLFVGKKVTAKTFGKEDILILKCFAGRSKDIGHVRALIKQKTNIKMVENHINSLIKQNIPTAQSALDFLDDILDEMGV